MYTYATYEYFFDENQYGFKKHYPTELAARVFINRIFGWSWGVFQKHLRALKSKSSEISTCE